MAVFTTGYYWEVITPEIEVVSDPDNSLHDLVPTVPEEDHFQTPNKYKFDVAFEYEDFTGETRFSKRRQQGRFMK